MTEDGLQQSGVFDFINHQATVDAVNSTDILVLALHLAGWIAEKQYVPLSTLRTVVTEVWTNKQVERDASVYAAFLQFVKEILRYEAELEWITVEHAGRPFPPQMFFVTCSHS